MGLVLKVRDRDGRRRRNRERTAPGILRLSEEVYSTVRRID